MASYPLSSQAPTHVEVELGCDNILRSTSYRSPVILGNSVPEYFHSGAIVSLTRWFRHTRQWRQLDWCGRSTKRFPFCVCKNKSKENSGYAGRFASGLSPVDAFSLFIPLVFLQAVHLGRVTES